MRFVPAGALGVWLVLALPVLVHASATLRFLRDDTEVGKIDLEALRRDCDGHTVSLDDPYYDARHRYRACPLAEVLERGFGEPVASLAGKDVLFRALDGYVKPTTGTRLAEAGGWLAFADADRTDGFAPLGRKAVDPGPFYVVWSEPHQRDTHAYPWPYQLAAIEVTDVTKRFPHTVPPAGARESPAWAGFGIFRTECIACHSINGEGGKVGPDLNIPQSIVEYRKPEQLKAYIRNPAVFRYGGMPSHEHLSAADLDALIAYFEAMKTAKHDPGATR